MAKVKFTAAVADMRNKMNGSVFSKNRGGSYLRTKVSPVQPRTSYQQAQKANLAARSSNWRALTAAQRATWNAGCTQFPYTDVFGDVKFLSGQQLYVKLNTNLQNAAQTLITTCPAPAAVPGVTITAAAAAAGTPAFTVTLSDATVPTGNSLIIWVTPEMGTGISFVKNKLRYLGKFTLTAGVANILTAYTTRFGTLVAAKNITVCGVYMSNTTGQFGVPFQFTLTVAA